MSQHYTEKLISFLATLRERGLIIGVAETMDAFEIIDGYLLEDRENTKAALRCLLSKSEREQEIFNECFDMFFVPAEVFKERVRLEQKEQSELEAEREKIIEELTFDGKPIELSEDLRETYADMDDAKREKLKNYLGLSTDNERRSPFTYNFMRRILEQHLKMEDAMYEADDAALGSDASALLYKDISAISDDEMPHAINLIQNMVKQLNGSISRAYRRSGRKGRLDFRATIRAGLSTGGLHKLKYKRRRASRKKIVLLCDVSGSMLKYSEFAIRFIKSMSDVSDNSRVFIFSEQLREVSPFVLGDMDSFQNYVRNSGLWGKGTDISTALNELQALRPQALGSNTVLMVISDTKCVNLPEARASMQRASKNAGKSIWLNPIPSRKWLKMGSVNAFIDLCDMLDCSTIHELGRACARSLAG